MMKKALIVTTTLMGVAAVGWLVWKRGGNTHAGELVKKVESSRPARLLRKAA